MNSNKTKTIKHRVIALLNREEIEFLEKLSMDALFSTGHKMSKTEIIAALVEAAMKRQVTTKGISHKQELVERLIGLEDKKIERREYPRLKMGLLVGLKKADSLEEYKDRITKNVSLGGFMVELDALQEPYKVGEVMELTIKDGEAFKALGRVTWINQNKETSRWEMGIQLLYIREEHLQMMKRNLNVFTVKE